MLSKSVHNKVFLWEPDLSSKQSRHKGYVMCYQVGSASILLASYEISQFVASANVQQCFPPQHVVMLRRMF